MLADYACLGMAFPGAPQNTAVGTAVIEAESAEALLAYSYTLMLVRASIWNVPVMEMQVGGTSELEKKIRG